jgi:hypothetical protein
MLCRHPRLNEASLLPRCEARAAARIFGPQCLLGTALQVTNPCNTDAIDHKASRTLDAQCSRSLAQKHMQGRVPTRKVPPVNRHIMPTVIHSTRVASRAPPASEIAKLVSVCL